MDQSSQSATQWAPIDDASIQIARMTENGDLTDMEPFWVPMESIEESEEMETSDEVVEDVTREEEGVETMKESIETFEVEQAEGEVYGEKEKEKTNVNALEDQPKEGDDMEKEKMETTEKVKETETLLSVEAAANAGGAEGVGSVGEVEEAGRGGLVQRGALLEEEGGGNQQHSDSDESISLLADEPIPQPFVIPPQLEEDSGYESGEHDEEDGWKTHDIDEDGVCVKCGISMPQNQLCNS